MNKDLLADTGIALIKMFCEDNQIPLPELNIIRDKNDPLCMKIKAVGTCGFYRSGKINVAVPLCANKNPSYSWPGFISDRTPYGVIQHELGHHVDEIKSGVNVYRNRPGDFFSDKIYKASGELPITSYAPNRMEWFAEIFRLFVTNPDLLKQIRPRAYDALLKEGFLPVVMLDAKSLLEAYKAPEKIFERMENWIKNKK